MMKGVSDELKSQIIEKLSGLPMIERIVLFGSRARGDAGYRSDIDLAVAAGNITPQQWVELRDCLDELDTLLPVDLVLLEEVAPSFQERIMAEGEIWFERH